MSIFRTFSAAANRPFFTPPITGINQSGYWEQIGQLPTPGYGRTGVWVNAHGTQAYATQLAGFPNYGASVLYNKGGVNWTQSGGNLDLNIAAKTTNSDGLRSTGSINGEFLIFTNTNNVWNVVAVDYNQYYVSEYHFHALSDDGYNAFFRAERVGTIYNKFFRWNGTGWSNTLTWFDGAGGKPNLGIGTSGAVSFDGERILVSGRASFYVYTSAGVQVGNAVTPQTSGFIQSALISNSGTRVAIQVDRNTYPQTEYVYEVYEFNGTSWQLLGAPISSGVLGTNSYVSQDGKWADANCTTIGIRRQWATSGRSIQFYTFNGTSWVTLGQEIQGELEFGRYIRLTSNSRRAIISGGGASTSQTARVYQYIP